MPRSRDGASSWDVGWIPIARVDRVRKLRVVWQRHRVGSLIRNWEIENEPVGATAVVVKQSTALFNRPMSI
jgi:hypothetical protein